MATITSFRELLVWKKAHELVLMVYRLTKIFPQNEMYGLVSQLRRAAVSVASNIVEGFHRASVLDSLHFYNMASASLEETKYQLLVAYDLGYISKEEYAKVDGISQSVSKMLVAWIASQKSNSQKK